MKNPFKALLSPKKALLLGIATFAVVTAGMVGLDVIRANAADTKNCDANAVVWCGADTTSQLAGLYNSGDGHNSAASIHNIYQWFGISSSDVTSMGTYTVEGSVAKNGDVYVGGTLVATGAVTGGRLNISGSTQRVQNGTTFYTRTPSVSFLQGSLTAMVVMKDGVFQFAVLHSCGNPVKATPKKPAYSIVKQVRAGTSGSYSSNVTVKSGSPVQYQITVSSTGAVPAVNVNVHDTLPAGVTYTAGTLMQNGVAVSATNASKFFGSGLVVSSIKNGNKVVFTFSAQAGTVSDTSASCNAAMLDNKGFISAVGLPTEQSDAKVNVTCTPPPSPAAACTLLNATMLDRDSFRLDATATTANGATISSYDFAVTDGAGKSVLTQNVPTTAKTASATVNLPAAGTYNAQVTVNTSLGAKTSAACKTQLTVKTAPVAACVSLEAIVTDRTKVALNATASAANGATISSYDFVVKNAAGTTVASPSVTATAKTATANVDLASAGDYTAQVTVNTSEGPKTNDGCKAKFTVNAAPAAACVNLDAIVADRTNVTLNAQASATNGATISAYDFSVKNSGGTVVASKTVTSTAQTASANVVLNDEGNYTAQVLVHTSLGDKTGAQCTAPIKITSAPKPNVTITKFVDHVKREQVAVNQNFIYEVTVKNTGEVDLTNVVVTDPAPQGVTMLSSDLGTIANNALSYTIPSLKVGASTNFTIAAKVTDYVAGDLVNTACVNAPEVNPTQPEKADACDTATVTVTPPTPKNPNITIVKTVDGKKQEQVDANQHFTYQLKITNMGEIDLTNVVVTDPAPQGVTMLATDQGSISSNALSYTIPSLKVGESVTVNITASVPMYQAGNIVNTACVNAPEVNPDQPTKDDACDTATVTITPPELPNTGAGNVIGIFAGVVVASTLGYRLLLGRKLARQEQ